MNRQSIHNALLKTKLELLKSVENQDNFLVDVCNQTKSDIQAGVASYYDKAFTYTSTTVSNQAYTFEKTSNSYLTAITKISNDGLAAFTANVNLNDLELTDTVEMTRTIDGVIEKEKVILGDICQQVSIGEDTNSCIIEMNERFLSSTNVDTSLLIETVNIYSDKLSSADISNLKSDILNASVDGKVSNYAWANIIKSICSDSANQVEDNQSIELDTSTPFSIQSFLNTVFTIIQSLFEIVLQALVILLRGLGLVLNLLFRAASAIFSLVGSNRITIKDSSTGIEYVRGAIAANDKYYSCISTEQTLGRGFIEIDNNIINNNKILKIENGCLDHYIWMQNFNDTANSRKVNWNSYCAPTYNYTRLMEAIADFCSSTIDPLNSACFPNGVTGWIDNTAQTLSIGTRFAKHFSDFLDKYGYIYLNPDSGKCIYLTADEMYRTTIDKDYATWAVWGSLRCQALLTTCLYNNPSYSEVLISKDTTANVFLSIGNWSLTTSTSMGMTSGSCIQTILSGLRCYTYGSSLWEFDTVTSGTLDSMAVEVRKLVQELSSKTRSNCLPYVSGNTAVYSLAGYTDASMVMDWYPFITCSDSPLYIDINNSYPCWMIKYSYNDQNTTHLNAIPYEVDSLPAKGIFDIPDFSVEDVITAMLLIAVAAAAITVGAKMLSAKFKARKQVKWAKRASDLNEKRKQWVECNDKDPNKKQYEQDFLKAVKSYNRKASLFGWPSYDSANAWYDYSSSSTGSIAASSTNFVDSVGQLIDSNNSLQGASNASLSYIVSLIKG